MFRPKCWGRSEQTGIYLIGGKVTSQLKSGFCITMYGVFMYLKINNARTLFYI